MKSLNIGFCIRCRSNTRYIIIISTYNDSIRLKLNQLMEIEFHYPSYAARCTKCKSILSYSHLEVMNKQIKLETLMNAVKNKLEITWQRGLEVLESKYKILFKTALLSIVTAGSFLVIITILKEASKSYPSLYIFITFGLALGFILAAIRVIYNVYLVSVSKRYLLGYETSLESIQIFSLAHLLAVIVLLLPFMIFLVTKLWQRLLLSVTSAFYLFTFLFKIGLQEFKITDLERFIYRMLPSTVSN